MGAEPWSYFVPYQEDVEAALEELKQREFEAGRYRTRDRRNPPATIEEAVKQAGDTGTQSILDMEGVSNRPLKIEANSSNMCLLAPLTEVQLVQLYGTPRPTRRMLERVEEDFWEWIDRGEGIYIVAFDGDRPSELFFAGYSFD